MSTKSIKSLDSFSSRKTLTVGDRAYEIFDVQELKKHGIAVDRLPRSLLILLENMLRHEDGVSVTADQIASFADWLKNGSSTQAIPFSPARVLLQDLTGVPAVVDLAAMRDAVIQEGGEPEDVNPLAPVDLVVDHSVMVDKFGSKDAFRFNVEMEFKRNAERYSLLRWAQQSFRNFRIVPPGTGICHQVNLEYLAQIVFVSLEKDPTTDRHLAYPDTVFGADSHTTMVNGIGVLGWGVGGIEAEAAMLGQPSTMVIPQVVGMRIGGTPQSGITATDIVLSITQILRNHGVVGKFVEFFGEGLSGLSVADRATISNMAPEYGATCGYFPIDQQTIRYLQMTGRSKKAIALVETYTRSTGLWREGNDTQIHFTNVIDFDLSDVEPCVAGPKRPQDRVSLKQVRHVFKENVSDPALPSLGVNDELRATRGVDVRDQRYHLCDGDVVIAAITSCTNTSNPSVMIAAGLLARNARQLGLRVRPWVKTSLAPGSQVVSAYLEESHLQKDLDALGFHVVGYGCTTCIGNSGPLPEQTLEAIEKHNLSVAAVLSGNRNFEARINPNVRANFLASPPLVVAYAIAGTVDIDLTSDPLAFDSEGQSVMLSDIWPEMDEINHLVQNHVRKDLFVRRYADVFTGQEQWQTLDVKTSPTFDWNDRSTYIRRPPFFNQTDSDISDFHGARLLALLGDSITTDHISPAGAFRPETPAGVYLTEHQVGPGEFNSYGARRGNHEVMVRGSFANARIRNQLAQGREGGFTKFFPDGDIMPIYEAAQRYKKQNVPAIVIAGREYGTGSSRDWAAKGTLLLGIKAVIAKSFERIHRSNLVGMGVLPLEFLDGTDAQTLAITGSETFDLTGLEDGISPRMTLTLTIHRDGDPVQVDLLCRIDTLREVEYFSKGGILPYMLSQIVSESSTQSGGLR